MIFIKGHPECRDLENRICEIAGEYVAAVDAGNNDAVFSAINNMKFFLEELHVAGYGQLLVEVNAYINNARTYFEEMTWDAFNRHQANIQAARELARD